METASASKIVPSSHSDLSKSVSMNLLLAWWFTPTSLGWLVNQIRCSISNLDDFSEMNGSLKE